MTDFPIKNPEQLYTPVANPDGDPLGIGEDIKIGEADLKEKSLETLAMHMNIETSIPGQANKYHPDPNELGVSDSSIHDDKSVPDTTAENEPQSYFQDIAELYTTPQTPGGVDPRSYFQTISDGGDPTTRTGGFFTAAQLKEIINKDGTNTEDTAKDGHEVLIQVIGDALTDTFGPVAPRNEDQITKTVSQVLQTNRFSPSNNSPYVMNRNYSNGMYTLQRKVGKYDPEAAEIAMRQIAKVGAALMLQGAGAPANETDPSATGMKSTQIGNGLGHKLSGFTLNSNVILARNVLGAPVPPKNLNANLNQQGIRWTDREPFNALNEGDGLEGNNSETYGHLNSYLEQFGGALPTSMILYSVLSASILIAVGLIFNGIIALIAMIGEEKVTPTTPEPYPLGSRKGQSNFGDTSISEMIYEFLRVPDINANSNRFFAFLYGALSFYFRISDIGSAAYFLIINRVAIRDSLQIYKAMENMSATDFIGGVEGIFVVLEAFASSTIIQFVNTITMLGEITIMSGDSNFGDGAMIFSPYNNVSNQPDFVYPAIHNIHLKSRTRTNDEQPDYRLAWRFGSLPSRYLLPTNIVTANLALGRVSPTAAPENISKSVDGEGKFGTATTTSRGGQPFQKNKISAIDRQLVENALDSYYMPFYFHDTRTNEIIALHAFIDNLSDSFSPQYNTVSGYGRMDPVRIYKNTTRNMSISFFMVATNPEDLSELYYSVNKLVTMVYPKWSKGAALKSSDNQKITMPFSQIPTASPLIRLRVGDLWSSNYSTNTLSRLFGLGTDNFKVKPEGATEPVYPYPDGMDQSAADEKVKEILMRVARDIGNMGYPPSVNSAILANSTAASPASSRPDRGIPIRTPVFVNPSSYPITNFRSLGPGLDIISEKPNPQNFKISDKTEGEVIGYSVRGGPPSNFLDFNIGNMAFGNNTYDTKKSKVRYVVRVSDGASREVDIICGQYDLKLDLQKMALKKYNDTFGSLSPGFAAPAQTGDKGWQQVDNGTQSFFSRENNSIVRSFEETGGKGIAGHITNLDFDWNMAPWDERKGSKAPTYCKVNIGFAPIHDIPLGLDSEGGIRAPAYNVGDLVRSIFGQGSLQSELRDQSGRTQAEGRAPDRTTPQTPATDSVG